MTVYVHMWTLLVLFQLFIEVYSLYNQDGNGYSGVMTSYKSLKGTISMEGYKNWPAGYANPASKFYGGVFDGTSIWMIPASSDDVIRIFTSNNTMIAYNSWPSGFIKGSGSFSGGVFDGTSIWMFPCNSGAVVRIFNSNGTMTMYKAWPNGASVRNDAYVGGVYDGSSIWMVPYLASHVIHINPSSGVMTGYNTWPSGYTKGTSKFAGGVYDGTSIWMIPFDADRVMRVNKNNGSMTAYNNWPSGYTKTSETLWGGVYDGISVWMVPCHANRLVRLFTDNGTMTGYNTWPSGFTKKNDAFSGGVFDGTFIWMFPFSADRVVRIDTFTGIMTGYRNWPNGFSLPQYGFVGGAFDGVSVWMIPYNADRVIRVTSTLHSMTQSVTNDKNTFMPSPSLATQSYTYMSSSPTVSLTNIKHLSNTITFHRTQSFTGHFGNTITKTSSHSFSYEDSGEASNPFELISNTPSASISASQEEASWEVSSLVQRNAIWSKSISVDVNARTQTTQTLQASQTPSVTFSSSFSIVQDSHSLSKSISSDALSHSHATPTCTQDDQDDAFDMDQTISNTPTFTRTIQRTPSTTHPMTNTANRIISHSVSLSGKYTDLLRGVRMGSLSITLSRRHPLVEVITPTLLLRWGGDALMDPQAKPRPYVEIRLHAARWRRNLSASEFVLRYLVCDDREYMQGRVEVAGTSTLSLLQDDRVLRLDMGGCGDMNVDHDILVSIRPDMRGATEDGGSGGDMTPTWLSSSPTSIVITASNTLPSQSLMSTTAIVGSTAAVVSVSSASPTGLAALQTMTLVGTMGCMPPAMRKMSNTSSWTLSPLYHLIGPLPRTTHDVNVIMWNVILFVFVFVLQYTIVVVLRRVKGPESRYAEVAEKVMFPSVTIMIVLGFMSSTFQAVFRLMGHDDAFNVIMGVSCVLMMCMMVYMSYRWIRYIKCGTCVSYDPYIPDSAVLGGWVYPRGVWLPLHENSRYGVLYGEFTAPYQYTQCVLFVQMGVIGLITSLSPTSHELCVVQALSAALVLLGVGVLMIRYQPHQVRLNSIFRGMTQVCQSTLLLIYVMSPVMTSNTFSDLMQGMSMIMLVLMMCDTTLVGWTLYWEISVQKQVVEDTKALFPMDVPDDISPGDVEMTQLTSTCTMNEVTFDSITFSLPVIAQSTTSMVNPKAIAKTLSLPILRPRRRVAPVMKVDDIPL